MAGPLLPRHRLPDWMDWLETGFPTMPLRWSLRDVHPIPIEESQEEGVYVLRAELPGVNPDDILVTVDDDALTVRAEHTEEKKGKRRSEFRYGSFERTVRLPGRIPEEGIVADYRDGILTVRVPLSETAEHTARTIPIRRSG